MFSFHLNLSFLSTHNEIHTFLVGEFVFFKILLSSTLILFKKELFTSLENGQAIIKSFEEEKQRQVVGPAQTLVRQSEQQKTKQGK